MQEVSFKDRIPLIPKNLTAEADTMFWQTVLQILSFCLLSLVLYVTWIPMSEVNKLIPCVHLCIFENFHPIYSNKIISSYIKVEATQCFSNLTSSSTWKCCFRSGIIGNSSTSYLQAKGSPWLVPQQRFHLGLISGYLDMGLQDTVLSTHLDLAYFWTVHLLKSGIPPKSNNTEL